jgi:hypothetical protein
MKRFTLALLAVGLLGAVVYYMFYPSSSGDDRTYWTKFYLSHLRIAIRHFEYDDLNRIESLDQFLEEAERQHFIRIAKGYRTDRWGTPLFWTVQKADGKITIRIISAGKNQIPEGGQGDDLWVEVEMSRDGEWDERQSWPQPQIDRARFPETARLFDELEQKRKASSKIQN